PHDAVRAVLAADFHQLVADLGDRLVPGDPLPLPVDVLHRVLEAALAMAVFTERSALGAMRAEIDRRVEVRLLAGPDAVLDLRDHAASHGTVSTDGTLDLDRPGPRGAGGLGRRALHHRGRQRGRERASAEREARAAQEC